MGIILKRLRADGMVRFAILLGVFLAACGGSDVADGPDAAAGTVDAADLADAVSEFPGPGFGQISGECDVFDDELISTQPSLVHSAFDFERLYVEADEGMLSVGGRRIIGDGNAGGSSVLSEVFAFEMLKRCEAAELLKTETQISYDSQGKLTDFLAEIDSEKIGVSVTRAVGFPFDDPYELAQASSLLEGKLGDILQSSENVSADDRWRKQILAVLAYAPEHADVLAQAWETIDATTRADTIVHIMVTNGQDDFIYCDGACP
ncbi:MAG: hypothetical protein GY811_04695 [Myxococcales bacterium]|nr:hypothetical protein [Myxococcales bacterium]